MSLDTVAATQPTFREAFPAIDRTTYLASCSLGARSDRLDAALTTMLDEMAEFGAPWDRFEQRVALVRRQFAALIGAQPEQIAIMPNASVGAFQAVSSLELGRRDRIVTCAAEFPSIAQVWLAQQARGAAVVFVDEPGLDPLGADYVKALDHRTALVSVPLVTYRTAVRPPVTDIVAAARAAGAVTFVDAYQGAGIAPVDVDRLGCDFLVAGTSKYLLGLPGLAFLYVREPAAARREPLLTGWFGRRDPFSFDPRRLDFPAEARRYETGTPPVPAIYAGTAGLALLGTVSQATVAAHVGHLVDTAIQRLTSDGHRVHADVEPSRRGAHVALLVDDPARLTRDLASDQVIVSPRGDVVRVAFHYYNNQDDIDRLIRSLHRHRSAGR